MLEVGRVLCVLESLALPYAAVYHTGEMHCHGEGMVDVYVCVYVCAGYDSGCVTERDGERVKG